MYIQNKKQEFLFLMFHAKTGLIDMRALMGAANLSADPMEIV